VGRYVGTFLLVALLIATAGVASSRYQYHHALLHQQQLNTEVANRTPRPFLPSGLVIPDVDEIGRDFQATKHNHNNIWQSRRKTQSSGRDAVSLSQSTFGSDEDVTVNFINANDPQPGDWIGIATTGAGDDGWLHEGEYITYGYGKGTFIYLFSKYII
jgi:hypothetical protein